MIICICRGKNERHIARAIDDGANSVSDLQMCGIGDQCGSCHNTLRVLLAQCAVCIPERAAASAPAHAHA